MGVIVASPPKPQGGKRQVGSGGLGAQETATAPAVGMATAAERFYLIKVLGRLAIADGKRGWKECERPWAKLWQGKMGCSKVGAQASRVMALV